MIDGLTDLLLSGLTTGGEHMIGPEANPQLTAVIHEGPNKRGEYLYTLIWWALYHPGDPRGEDRHAMRGQVFLGNPDDHEVDMQIDSRNGGRIIWKRGMGPQRFQ